MGIESRGVSVDQLLRVALALPEVTQRPYGADGFSLRVRDRGFAYVNEAEDRATIKSVPAERDALVAAEPEVFRPSWSSGRFTWVEVRLPTVDPTELAELLTEAWRLTAPKRLIAAPPPRHRPDSGTGPVR